MEACIWECDIFLVSKVVKHQFPNHFLSLSVITHCWKNLSIDFITCFPILTNWKRDSYDAIFVIVEHLTKMVYYMLLKITINVADLAEIIINIVVRHYGFLESIISNKSLLFILKLCLYYAIFLALSKIFLLYFIYI